MIPSPVSAFEFLFFLDTVTPPGGNVIMPHTTGPPLTGWEPEVKMIAIPLYSITMFLSLVGNILGIYVLYKRPETRRLTFHVCKPRCGRPASDYSCNAGVLNSHINGRKMDK